MSEGSESTQRTSYDGAMETHTIDPVTPLFWGAAELVRTPLLMVFVAVASLLSSSVLLGNTNELGLVLAAGTNLVIAVVTYQHAGKQFDGGWGSDSKFEEIAFAIPKLLVVYVLVLLVSLAYNNVVISFAASYGLPAYLLAVVVWLAIASQMILAAPAVCVEPSLIDGIRLAWTYSQAARGTLLVLAGGTLAAMLFLQGMIFGSSGDMRLVYTLATGALGAASNLAYAFVYLTLRSEFRDSVGQSETLDGFNPKAIVEEGDSEMD